MILAVLACGHRLLADEDQGAQTSDYCPECGLWLSVEGYEEKA